jgi:hypothetical protein
MEDRLPDARQSLDGQETSPCLRSGGRVGLMLEASTPCFGQMPDSASSQTRQPLHHLSIVVLTRIALAATAEA